jgi:hypothetical protein
METDEKRQKVVDAAVAEEAPLTPAEDAVFQYGRKLMRAWYPEVDREEMRDREDYEDVKFQVYCKYNAHGYGSPEEMLENEPDMRRLLQQGRQRRKRAPKEEPTRTEDDARLEQIAREIVAVAKSEDPEVRRSVRGLDARWRKAVHEMCEKGGVAHDTVDRQNGVIELRQRGY